MYLVGSSSRPLSCYLLQGQSNIFLYSSREYEIWSSSLTGSRPHVLYLCIKTGLLLPQEAYVSCVLETKDISESHNPPSSPLHKFILIKNSLFLQNFNFLRLKHIQNTVWHYHYVIMLCSHPPPPLVPSFPWPPCSHVTCVMGHVKISSSPLMIPILVS